MGLPHTAFFCARKKCMSPGILNQNHNFISYKPKGAKKANKNAQSIFI